MNDSTALREAFARTRRGSKHACYQDIPSLLQPLLPAPAPGELRRHDRERLRYLLARLGVAGRSVLDIGCNGGFFLLELLAAGASRATGYEGSRDHAEFLAQAAAALGLGERLQVHPRYYDFQGDSAHHDVALLLNVLHHVGDDYGDRGLNIAGAREEILRSLRRMRERCDVLVFQLGFNWKGERDAGLFAQGSIAEMVEFVEQGARGSWRLRHVGVAERLADGGIEYRELGPDNGHRKNELGEFLNRPLFILD
ncbi:class I SAM-dependent methyltransferase [[Pseudomonas] boreopolis]|uniref:class I SAM-dependent methyltransferase n=1 Tax=Xanthomonas boreopolis TaxID=86183 RepID=UPI003D45E3D8